MADINELMRRLRQMEIERDAEVANARHAQTERDAEAAKARHAQAVLQTLRALSTLRTPAHACANRRCTGRSHRGALMTSRRLLHQRRSLSAPG
jgi:hypothetical protein